MSRTPSMEELARRAQLGLVAPGKPEERESSPTPSRARIMALKERVLMPLEAIPAEQVSPAEKRAIEHLNDGLLWLMEQERANFYKGVT